MIPVVYPVHPEEYGHWDVADIRRLLHERDALKRDAERYRWLRAIQRANVVGYSFTAHRWRDLYGSDLDTVIDSDLDKQERKP